MGISKSSLLKFAGWSSIDNTSWIRRRENKEALFKGQGEYLWTLARSRLCHSQETCLAGCPEREDAAPHYSESAAGPATGATRPRPLETETAPLTECHLGQRAEEWDDTDTWAQRHVFKPACAQPTITVGVEAGTCIHLWVVGTAGGGGSCTCRHLATRVGRATAKSSHGCKGWRHGLWGLGSHLLVTIHAYISIYCLQDGHCRLKYHNTRPVAANNSLSLLINQHWNAQSWSITGSHSLEFLAYLVIVKLWSGSSSRPSSCRASMQGAASAGRGNRLRGSIGTRHPSQHLSRRVAWLCHLWSHIDWPAEKREESKCSENEIKLACWAMVINAEMNTCKRFTCESRLYLSQH